MQFRVDECYEESCILYVFLDLLRFYVVIIRNNVWIFGYFDFVRVKYFFMIDNKVMIFEIFNDSMLVLINVCYFLLSNFVVNDLYFD